MSFFGRKIELPAAWQDERLQSAAALLSLAVGMEVHPDSDADVRRRLESARDDLGLDPDQIHRALSEHEAFIGFAEPDHVLMRGAFTRLFSYWDPRPPKDEH